MLPRNAQQFLLRRNSISHPRWQSANSRPGHKAHEEAIDFRPPWVYVASRLMTFTIIPGIVIYSVFFYNFGDRDHVFQPVRRWALEQKAAFLTLSPDEKRVLAADASKGLETS